MRHCWERGWEAQSLIQLPALSLHSPMPQYQPTAQLMHGGWRGSHNATRGAMAADSPFLTLKHSYMTELRKTYTEQVTLCCSHPIHPSKMRKCKCKY